MRATVCFGVLAALIGGCREKAKPSPDTAAPAQAVDDHDHHGHEHHGHDHHGHEHGDEGGAPPAPTNPYVYEPLAVPIEPPPAPVGEPAGDMTFSGVTFEVLANGRGETVALSKAVLAARAGGPIATWDCNPKYGVVNIVDFAIGDAPDKVGAAFVVRVDASRPSEMRAGTPTDARISLRRGGEPGLTTARAVATWDEGYKSGRAVATQGLEYALEVRWTCADEAP